MLRNNEPDCCSSLMQYISFVEQMVYEIIYFILYNFLCLYDWLTEVSPQQRLCDRLFELLKHDDGWCLEKVNYKKNHAVYHLNFRNNLELICFYFYDYTGDTFSHLHFDDEETCIACKFLSPKQRYRLGYAGYKLARLLQNNAKTERLKAILKNTVDKV